jgi:hypothetical protein
MKALKIMMLLVCMAVLALGVSAAAIPISVTEVEINDLEVSENANVKLSQETGEDLEIQVRFTALEDAENVQVEAFISGYEYNDFEPMSDSTHVFDIEEGVEYTKTLDLTLPEKTEEDEYKLRIIISDRYSDVQVLNYNLKIDVPRHKISVKDIWFTPENRVMTGDYLITSVRLKNYGDKDEEGIKVEVSIPELGISAVDYIDELESDDSISSEELYLKIPRCGVKAGDYEVKVKVSYDEGYEITKHNTEIVVNEDEPCVQSGNDNDKVIIALEGDQITLNKEGEGAMVPITLTNKGTSSKTFIIGLPNVDWADFEITPSNVLVLGADETRTAFVSVEASEDAVVGEQAFVISISNAEGETLKDLTFRANVEGDEKADMSTLRVLAIILGVLLIILILIGLIIGFRKLMTDEEYEEDEAATETYY